jgi:DNA-binding protein HU-beta
MPMKEDLLALLTVPTQWELLDEALDASMTEAASEALQMAQTGSCDAQRAAAHLYQAWRALVVAHDSADDTDVRESVYGFFSSLLEAGGAPTAPERLWQLLSLGLVDHPPLSFDHLVAMVKELCGDSEEEATRQLRTKADSLREDLLNHKAVELPGVGMLVPQVRAARSGERHQSPRERLLAYTRGEAVAMPAQATVILKPSSALKAALQRSEPSTSLEQSSEGELAAAIAVAIGKLLAEKGSCSWAGLGVFCVATRPARQGRDPTTGEPIEIPGKKQPVFLADPSVIECLKATA